MNKLFVDRLAPCQLLLKQAHLLIDQPVEG
jgi:hypothetical protein